MGEIHELFVLASSLVWFAGVTPDLGILTTSGGYGGLRLHSHGQCHQIEGNGEPASVKPNVKSPLQL